MNMGTLLQGLGPARKTSLELENVANQVDAHLRRRVPELFGLRGVWVTGSNVWRWLYDMVPDPESDIDVIVETDEAREEVRRALGLVGGVPTAPSTAGRADLNGMKSLTEDGRTVDVWSSATVLDALRAYPDHSHAHAMAAYNTSDGTLLVMPNPRAHAKIEATAF